MYVCAPGAAKGRFSPAFGSVGCSVVCPWYRSAPVGSPGSGGRWVDLVGNCEGLFCVVVQPSAANCKRSPRVPIARSKDLKISRYVEWGEDTQIHLASMWAFTGHESLVLQAFINIKWQKCGKGLQFMFVGRHPQNYQYVSGFFFYYYWKLPFSQWIQVVFCESH